MHVIPENGGCMFSCDVHIEMFCGPRCCLMVHQVFSIAIIVPSVVIKGCCGCFNLAGIIWNIVCE